MKFFLRHIVLRCLVAVCEVLPFVLLGFVKPAHAQGTGTPLTDYTNGDIISVMIIAFGCFCAFHGFITGRHR